ncbi:MAG: hypothetical protein JWM05_3290, partial [Acidimicrobiales bacterium]|nr:hypothetical protein [Acidimicrobiales bacterium]
PAGSLRTSRGPGGAVVGGVVVVVVVVLVVLVVDEVETRAVVAGAVVPLMLPTATHRPWRWTHWPTPADASHRSRSALFDPDVPHPLAATSVTATNAAGSRPRPDRHHRVARITIVAPSSPDPIPGAAGSLSALFPPVAVTCRSER